MTRFHNRREYYCGRCGPPAVTRRKMLERSGMGFGALALGGLLADDRASASSTHDAPNTESRRSHFSPTATSAIYLYMQGGPSHVDSYDPKPELTRLDGQEPPDSIVRLFTRTALMGDFTRKLMASPFKFRRYGESGLPVSELFSETAKHVDKMCILRSLQHDSVLHAPGQYIMTTGTLAGDRPSLGAWVLYGLGSETKDLPGFVVLGSSISGSPIRRPAYSMGFLPASYQGTRIHSVERGIPHLDLPLGVDFDDRRRQLVLVDKFNRRDLARYGASDAPDGRQDGGAEEEAEMEARIRSYELAFRMQAAAPEAFDLRRETEATKRLYGYGDPHPYLNDLAMQCLLARRLVERGVRFVHIIVPGWDAHVDLKGNHENCARRSDRPTAGLLTDLEQRGLLDQTLVIWGGEFGRTPTIEKGTGRGHCAGGFTMWLAGGGVQGGQAIGQTDPVGFTAIDRVISPNMFHATILHALGIDDSKLTYLHNGRDEIPTFLESEVVGEVFA